VLGASGDQLVYVDELSPNEVLLLMQLVFLLEERLKRNAGAVDYAQRIPHTFGYLDIEPIIDVMLKRFFDEVPFQCTTTGLRFATREKLRKHYDALYRRRQAVQNRQSRSAARDWMENIADWVGNRDLVVGPALFRLGGAADDQVRAQEHLRAAESSHVARDGSSSSWVCPMDARRSVCPVSGEPFARIWSEELNDWAFADVAVAELGSSKPVRFPQGSNNDEPMPQLTETAVLYKRSCFFNTGQAKRLQALEECRSIHCFAAAPTEASVSVEGKKMLSPPPSSPSPSPAEEEPELADFRKELERRPTPGRFF
jgi:hypothetical protein